MKIWTNNKFEGCWPIGTAAVVIAETAEQAAKYLSVELEKVGLPSAEISDMKEMVFVDGNVCVLADGDY